MPITKRNTGISIESGGRFGTAFHNALIKKNLSLVEFSRQIDGNYEHFRKIFKGQMYPSPRLLTDMCDILGLKKSDAEVMLVQDRMEKKVGKRAFHAAVGRNPHAGEFDSILPHLSEDSIQLLLIQARAMLDQKRDRKGA